MKLIQLLEKVITQAVGNFNKSAPSHVDTDVFRGGRPLNAKAIEELKDIGIETVICLLKSSKQYQDDIANVDDEKKAVEAAGMKFIHFDITEEKNPTLTTINKFLSAVKTNGKVYMHCSAGQDRVGLFSAIYEVEVMGKTFEEAYTGMLLKGHDFVTFPNIDKFFYEYCKRKFKKSLDVEYIVRKTLDKEDAEELLDYIFDIK